MQPTLILIALLAPLPAAAFGDLDCISIRSCDTGQNTDSCTQRTEPFAITFDWADDTAVVTMFGTDHALIWMHTGDGDDALATHMEYGDGDRTLQVVTNGSDITAYYTINDPAPENTPAIWVGVCDVRRAA